MKKFLMNIIYLSIIFSVYGRAEHQKDDHFNLRSVGYVQKRNYLIRRLEEPVKTLSAVQKQLIAKGFFKEIEHLPLDQAHSKLFHHPSIQEVTQAIITEQSIEPFYRVWGDFLSYRYLQNNSFVRETIMLLLLLYKKMLLQLLVDQNDESTRLVTIIDNCLSKSEHSISDMVEQAGLITRATKKAVIRYYPELTSLLSASHHIPTELCEGIDCDDVHDNLSALVYLLDEDESNDAKYEMLIINSNMRFYHIQRLLRPIFLLSKQGYDFKLPKALVQEQFHHTRLKQCIIEMHDTNSTIPIFKLWKSLACYEYINDKLFMKEYIQLIVIVFQNLLAEYPPLRYKAILTTTDVLTLYQQITAMPVPELLDLLDEVVDQFAQASSEYELDNKTMSWTEWLQQYWWAPPVMIGSLFITIIKHGSALHKLIKSLIKNPFATR